MAKKPMLGARLRALREERGLSLRKVAKDSGINSGYLSQLERDEIAQPTPGVLQKVAVAYGEPLGALMRWAGYIEDDPTGLSPNAKRALSYLGDDFSEEELAALKAVLEVIRQKGGAAFSLLHRYDRPLEDDDKKEVGQHAVAVLRELDALGKPPTNLDDALVVAKLVKAGAITLTLDERKKLRRFFGDMADWAFSKLQGVLHLDAGEVWVNPEITHPAKQRFVLAHEVGHAVLPAHRETFAYLDDAARLRADVADLFERQANHFSIELLAQGDTLREVWDSSEPSISHLEALSKSFAISLQATARHVAERSQRPCAIAVSFRGRGGQGVLGSPHLFTSPSFESRLRWKFGRCPTDYVRSAIAATARNEKAGSFLGFDAEERALEIQADGLDAFYAVMVLFTCDPVPRRVSARITPLKRSIGERLL